ncbi:DUF6097 family protein [Paenibacillus sanguinis]|uniref:DUF6097 family protein n=1 Tax=Paenibacillus sanguinis TaxID=225906 RepID=UPI00037542C9|nr:DUF6097 family protein [Paenibacillus sanguinis]
MNVGRILLKTLEFSHELDVLHKHITTNQLPVRKSDSFDKQCFFLEEYLKEDTYQSVYRKMNAVNKWSGIVAAPVFLIIAVAFVYGKWINPSFDVIGFFVDNPMLYIVPAILIVITLMLALVHQILRKKLYEQIYPRLKAKLEVRELEYE